MKTHAIIPIFIPHAGCPHDCVFCNQKAITARTAPPTLDAVVDTIERNLTTIKANSSIKTVEIAFFGGSFTGIPLDEQSAYLDIAKSYKDRGLIDMIHMSTRPDYIDEKILDNLKKYAIDLIKSSANNLKLEGIINDDIEQIANYNFNEAIFKYYSFFNCYSTFKDYIDGKQVIIVNEDKIKANEQFIEDEYTTQALKDYEEGYCLKNLHI